MATEIYIVSGFLGAGKTTLIQKLLREAFQGQRVAIIENDFGEISIDAAVLRSGGFEVREMNSGCICCSLSGNFVGALTELLERFEPETVIIEPSGVGKLSDVVRVCSDKRIVSQAHVAAKITVADARRCRMYLDNFGEFFEDQIMNADVVVLSRTDGYSGTADAVRMIKQKNPRAAVISAPQNEVTAENILGSAISQSDGDGHNHTCAHNHGCVHAHHNHDDHDDHKDPSDHRVHSHTAEEAFQTVTVYTEKVFSQRELREAAREMECGAAGTVLRAKGIVRGKLGYWEFQYAAGDLVLRRTNTEGGVLCIIGRGLDRRRLTALCGGA